MIILSKIGFEISLSFLIHYNFVLVAIIKRALDLIKITISSSLLVYLGIDMCFTISRQLDYKIFSINRDRKRFMRETLIEDHLNI